MSKKRSTTVSKPAATALERQAVARRHLLQALRDSRKLTNAIHRVICNVPGQLELPHNQQNDSAE